MLTKSQQEIFDQFKLGKNIFITGKGGTGKSYLTRYIIHYCKEHKLKTMVCAPTGVAAQNIGGATIHSTFKVPLQIVLPNKYCTDKRKMQIIRSADVIIIDEISMCRIDVFQFICNTLNMLPTLPQLILVGDFFQLPPVLANKNNEIETWNEIPEYKGKLFPFESDSWKDLGLITMELTEQMRQSETSYINALDDIREGIPNFNVFKQGQEPDSEAITLCTTNLKAFEKNEFKLNELISKGAKWDVYESRETGIVKPTDRQTEQSLKICVGARIVFIMNDADKQYSNGEMGTITDLSHDSIDVVTDSGRYVTVRRYKWSIGEYKIKNERDEDGFVDRQIYLSEIGTFEQLPIRLAWAVTVHKSQGQTYDKVNIMANNFFADGQMYVALSRCKNLEGMHIIGYLSEDDLFCNEKVLKFMRG